MTRNESTIETLAWREVELSNALREIRDIRVRMEGHPSLKGRYLEGIIIHMQEIAREALGEGDANNG